MAQLELHAKAVNRNSNADAAADVLIATFCIDNGYTLLHKDRDFDIFERVRGLRAWKH